MTMSLKTEWDSPTGIAESDIPETDQYRLPDIVKATTLLGNESLVHPEQIVHGVIGRGMKGVLGSNSKARKTWILIQLGVCVAAGKDWWGRKTNKGKVMFINFEIQEAFFKTRLKSICDALELKSEDIDNLDVWTLRGHAASLGDLVPELIDRLQGGDYSLIIIDPIYKGLGGRDENSAGDISELCNELERIAVGCKAAVFYASHYSKGNQAGKEAIDRIAGSGVWTRDADTIITLTKHKEEQDNAFTVDLILRNYPEVDPFVISWEFPMMKLRPDLDPDDLKQKTGRPKSHEAEELLPHLQSGQMTTTQWQRKVREETGMSPATFHRLVRVLNSRGAVSKDDAGKTWLKATTEYQNSQNPVLIKPLNLLSPIKNPLGFDSDSNGTTPRPPGAKP